MRFLIIFILLPTIVYADQGVNIFCVNMKKLLDKEYKIHKFKFDVTTFQYFDEKKNIFVEVPNKNLIIKPNFFAARFSEYELGFQVNEFKDGRNPIIYGNVGMSSITSDDNTLIWDESKYCNDGYLLIDIGQHHSDTESPTPSSNNSIYLTDNL